MAQLIERGQRAMLDPLTDPVLLRVNGAGVSRRRKPVHLDVSAFGLTRLGRIADDRYFVFYGNDSSPDGAIRWREVAPGRTEIRLALSLLPPVVDGMAFSGTIHEARQHEASLGDISGASLELTTTGGTVLVRHVLPAVPPHTALDACVMGVLFREDGRWVMRASGDAYDFGLRGIATGFGVAVG